MSTVSFTQESEPLSTFKDRVPEQYERKSLARRLEPLNADRISTMNPTVYVRAGASGVRHLYPVHLVDSNGNATIFSRSISRLRSCSNTEVIRHVCASIPTLQHWDVSSNDLDDLPLDVALLVHLETFDCSHNHLQRIPNLTDRLKELDISFNRLVSLPATIASFQSLVRLNGEHNLLKSIDASLAQLNKLQVLILDHNQLSSVADVRFEAMLQLEAIHIAHNRLRNFPHQLHRLSHLKTIDLSHNRLTSFPTELLLVHTLDVLNLSHNAIDRLARSLNTYKRRSTIFSIDLSFNQLTRFYEYLPVICLKLDLSHNRISSMSNGFMRKFTREMLVDRELKLHHNPVVASMVPSDVVQDENGTNIDILHVIRHSFEEERINRSVRQGFKLSIIGGEQSGKTALGFCLEENVPWVSNETNEKLVHIHQYPFALESKAVQPTLVETAPIETVMGSLAVNQRSDRGALPVTVFDFGGSPAYHPYLPTLAGSTAVYLLCISAVEFHRETADETNEVTSSSSTITRLLQVLTESVATTRSLIILPVATGMDLYGKRPAKDKTEVLEKIDQFFQLDLRHRLDQIRREIDRIDSLPTISNAQSSRRQIYQSRVDLHPIEIKPCQPLSALTCEGVRDLRRNIEKCVVSDKRSFPHVDRILPALWIDAYDYLESLGDQLPVPYLAWEDFHDRLDKTYGLGSDIDEITVSLIEQGKILVLNDLDTSERLVVLRPAWFAELLSSLLCRETLVHCTRSSNVNDLLERGLLHWTLLCSLWSDLLHSDDDIHRVWFTLMRFLGLGYPRVNGTQQSTSLPSALTDFDAAVIPHYLPLIPSHEHEQITSGFLQQSTSSVSICYSSVTLPPGFFHRYCVSAVLRLNVICINHWNDLLLGQDADQQVTLLLETDHRTYIRCHCGTSANETPFDIIWNRLISLGNHFELLFRTLAPNHLFDRFVRCPACHDYCIMGEWMTPKRLQNLQTTICPSCNQAIETIHLVQPSEGKQRNDDILKRIQQRTIDRHSSAMPMNSA